MLAGTNVSFEWQCNLARLSVSDADMTVLANEERACERVPYLVRIARASNPSCEVRARVVSGCAFDDEVLCRIRWGEVHDGGAGLERRWSVLDEQRPDSRSGPIAGGRVAMFVD
jgi:hypothetical protein